MFVTIVLGDCPACGNKNCFGNVSVRGDHILRGCRHCRYSTTVWLPEIQKKVLYLDQFFFSGAFRGEDSRFVEAAERVQRAAGKQVLVTPYSSVHEDETHEWRGYGGFTHTNLLKFIKSASGGAEFQPDYEIEATQVTKAWAAFLANADTQFVLELDEAIQGSVDEWDDYLRIEVGGYHKDVELRRTLKGQAFDGLMEAFEAWRTSTQTFDQDVALEMDDAARYYYDTYLTMMKRLAQRDFDARFDSPIASQVVERMMHSLPDNHPFDQKLQRCVDFFRSEHFRQVPNLWISARMFATLKDMVKRGAFRQQAQQKRHRGVFDDIKHISMYAPYCDAFFMDQAMAEIVRHPRVNLEGRYGVRVFSLNNLAEFFAWIDALEANLSAEHKRGLAEAYPGRVI